MDIYRQTILDHYKNPRNYGHLSRPEAKFEEANVSCGDRIGMELTFKIKSVTFKVIQDIRFHGEGCAISQASASMLTETVKGMKREDVMALSLDDVQKLLGTTLTPSRVKCALLPLEAIQKAVAKVR